jgi:transposase
MRPHRLVACLAGRFERSGKKGGEETGPNPTDRGRPGSKHHIIVERQGIPLLAKLTPANVNDSKPFNELLDSIPPIRTAQGGRRRRPDKLHADKAYDHVRCRAACRVRGITPRIARRGIETCDRLGRYRWVVERTFSWLHRFRRLVVRYERRADIHRAFLSLGAALLCLNFVAKWFC